PCRSWCVWWPWGDCGRRGPGHPPLEPARSTGPAGDTEGAMSQANVELVRSLQPSGVDLVAVFEDGHLDQAGAFDASGGVFDPRFESSFIAGESAGRPRLT